MATILVEDNLEQAVSGEEIPARRFDTSPSTETKKVVGKAQCIGLFGVDPQNTFGHVAGEMYCNSGIGGEKALQNAGAFISNNVDVIHRLILTGDDHTTFHIGCVAWFINDRHEHPSVFSVVSSQDFDRGVWRCTLPEYQAWTSYYLHECETAGKPHRLNLPSFNQHMVFPMHGTRNTFSAAFVDSIQSACLKWETYHRRNVSIFRKGRNPRVEQLSAIRAEIIDPDDPSTRVNENILSELSQCHKIGAFGLALSHCLGLSLLDILDVRPDLIERITLLTDATVDVKGYEAQGEKIVSTLVNRGMGRSTTKEWLK